MRGKKLQNSFLLIPEECFAHHVMMVQTMSQTRPFQREVVLRFSQLAARVKMAPALEIDWEDWE